MQIEILAPTKAEPLPAVRWNYEQLKAQLSEALESYKGRVYTDETIVLAKKDRANLNKLADAIDGKRKEMKSMYLQPYEEFERQAKELTAMVKEQSAAIDAQVKAYEEQRRQDKQAKIMELYSSMIGELAALVPYERLHNPKWLNVTASMGAISEDMGRKIDKIAAGLSSIDTLNLAPDIADQVKGVFLKDYDLAAALAERERIEKQREELARYKAAQEGAQSTPSAGDKYTRQRTEIAAGAQEPRNPADSAIHTEAAEKIHTETLYTVAFKVEATAEQLEALKAFLKSNNIRYGRA